MIELLALLSNLFLAAMLLFQHRRMLKYRDRIHALLADDGHVDGEPEIIVDEMLRMMVHLKMREPTLQEFGYSLARQKAFRKAVAHAELYNIYVETQGRKP